MACMYQKVNKPGGLVRRMTITENLSLQLPIGVPLPRSAYSRLAHQNKATTVSISLTVVYSQEWLILETKDAAISHFIKVASFRGFICSYEIRGLSDARRNANNI